MKVKKLISIDSDLFEDLKWLSKSVNMPMNNVISDILENQRRKDKVRIDNFKEMYSYLGQDGKNHFIDP